MTSWPAHTFELRPYRQASRGGSKQDRTLTEIEVSLPPMIGALVYQASPRLISPLETAVADLREVDSGNATSLNTMASFLIRTDSIASSKIESIEASTEDFARAIAGSKANQSATMMAAGAQAITSLIDEVGVAGKFTVEAVLNAHQTLLAEDETEARFAGRFREVQNWIGGSNYSPHLADYIPPPPELVRQYMDDLLEFLNRDDIPVVAQAAIGHAQFESIHPFTDGNGRVGRAIINAVFRRRGVSRRVLTPVASALVANQSTYFKTLVDYRAGQVDELILNLSLAAQISSREALVSALIIETMPSAWLSMAKPRSGSAAERIINLLVEHPVLSAEQAENLLGSSMQSIYEAMDALERAGVVHELTNRQRNKVWAATAVLTELESLNLRIAHAVRRFSAN
jgi:Fic family protein